MVMPLAFAGIAYVTLQRADHAFDERMRRDRAELEQHLREHGATPAQAADVTSFQANAAHSVSGYVGTVALAVIATTSFMGITLASLLGARGERDGPGERGGNAAAR